MTLNISNEVDSIWPAEFPHKSKGYAVYGRILDIIQSLRTNPMINRRNSRTFHINPVIHFNISCFLYTSMTFPMSSVRN